MEDCKKCNGLDKCKCEKLIVPGPMYAFPMESYIWTGNAITCGNTPIISPGQNLAQAFLALATYACNLQLTPGPAGVPGVPGPAGLNELLINKTIFVSENGTPTGSPYDLTKTFNTLEAAAAVAQAGDTIYVFPGNYTPLTDWLISNVNYYFLPGSAVITSGNCISDYGNAKNIFIFGKCRFISTRGRALITTNSQTNIIVECLVLDGYIDCVLIVDCNSYSIKSEYMHVSFQYLVSIRGNNEGHIHADTYDARDSFLGSSAILVFAHSTNGLKHRLIFTGNMLYSNGQSPYGSVVGCILSGDVIIDWRIKSSLHTDTSGTGDSYMIFITAGSFKAHGCNFQSENGKGILQGNDGVTTNTFIELESCKLKATKEIYDQSNQTVVNFIQNQLVTTGASTTHAINFNATSVFYCSGNLIFVDGSANYNAIHYTVDTVSSYLSNNTVRNNNPTGLCIGTSLATSIPVAYTGNNYSNVAADVLITNTVTGTSLISDSDINVPNNLIPA